MNYLNHDAQSSRDKPRVWITGANGMVGRNLREHPRAAAWQLLTPSRGELDLTDRAAVADYARTTRPACVIHAAGQVGGIQANIGDPIGFLVNNLDIGRNVVMAAAEANIPALINLSSSCMYPRDRSHALRESDIMTGELEPTNEGYALSKIIATRLCEYVGRVRPEFSYRTLIPCNLYGRYDKFDPAASHLVPAIIAKIDKAIHSGEDEVEIWGDGSARREFMYAADLADAIWRAADDPARLPSLMNIGVGADYSILEYYQAVANVMGWTGNWRFLTDKPTGMRRKMVDVSQQHAWGWTPHTSLHEGLRMTFEYYSSLVTHG